LRNLKSPCGYVTRVIHRLIMHGMVLVGLAEKGPRGAEAHYEQWTTKVCFLQGTDSSEVPII
jgi:hypothetical protein